MKDALITIEDIAKVCHQQNKAYCEILGDNSQSEWKDAPENIKQSAYAGVTSILDGRVKKPEDSHNNWIDFKLQDGWKLGEIKDVLNKIHPSLIHFKELPIVEQIKDTLFFNTASALLQLRDKINNQE